MIVGTLFDINRFAIHDGPGIRTTVFLKGCPLICPWCHNPESQPTAIEYADRPEGTVPVGRRTGVGELMAEIQRDVAFYDESGGGVTFSGGEPLAQPEFLAAMLDCCGRYDIHRAVDTSGYAPRDTLLEIARRTDLFLYDLKVIDSRRHVALTGVANEPIHANLAALCETGVGIELRVPVVPGISDTGANLQQLIALVQSLPRRPPLRLLPYHRAAMDKYPRFGLPAPLPDTPEPSEDELEHIRRTLTSSGLVVAP